MIREPVRAWVGLGGNLGNVEVTLNEALLVLDGLPQTSVRAQSSFYRSPPWGRSDQPAFINAAVELQTRLAPQVLLDYLLEIETRFGRVRKPEDKWGPRKLDLDLLVYGDEQLNQPGMHVPHPRLSERAFVLVPMNEIAPKLDIPGHGLVRDLLAALDASGIEAMG